MSHSTHDGFSGPGMTVPSCPSRPVPFQSRATGVGQSCASRFRDRPPFDVPLCARPLRLATPGVLGSGASSVVSPRHRLLRPHPPDSQARSAFAALPLIHRAFAVRARLGDPRALPYFHCCPFHTCHRPYAGGSADPVPLRSVRDVRLPPLLKASPPTTRRLCQQCLTDSRFRRCIVRVMLRPVRLPCPPDWLRPDGVGPARPSEDVVVPAFGARRHRTALGTRLDGRTGNSPSSGLAPDQ